MSGGRTIWRAKDTGWRNREWIVILGEEFGAAGPAVIDWLEDQAKLQNDGGRVKAGPRAIARGAFVDLVTVGHVLSRSVTLGLLVEYEERQGRFECVVSWFSADQGKGGAAFRKARQREADPVKPDDPPPLSRSVPVGHGESQNVPLQDRTGQNTSATQKNNSSSDADGVDVKATDEDRHLCALLKAQALDRNAKFKVKSRSRWLTDMRRLRDLDGNSAEEIERAIRWVFRDDFWGGVIQSPGNLREHFPTIWDRMQKATVVPIRGDGNWVNDYFAANAVIEGDCEPIDESEAS